MYSARRVDRNAEATYHERRSETRTKPAASKRKLKRSDAVGAPKTLKMLTVRRRAGVSAKKKLTKLIRAIATTSSATASSERVVGREPGFQWELSSARSK